MAADAYDTLAPIYDILTAGYPYERWIGGLHAIALGLGWRGRHVLDVGCGTGHSLFPWLERGYDVTGVDVSPGMVAVARRKAAGRAAIHVADVRALPPIGPFELVTCLGDVMNHLLEPEDVDAALREIHRVLAPGGLAIFDVNLLIAYRDTPDTIVEAGDRVVLWPGAPARGVAPGGVAELVVDVFEREGDLWRRVQSSQPHRHHPLADVLERVSAAGLELAAVYGQHPGARLERPADERVHAKAIVIARR